MSELNRINNEAYESRLWYVYFMLAGGLTKVGYTTNMDQRIKDLRHMDFPWGVRNFLPIEQIQVVRTDTPILLEKQIHELLFEERVINEWFFLKKKDLEALKDLFDGSLGSLVYPVGVITALKPYAEIPPVERIRRGPPNV